ncbi:hypothetical protein [Chryseobacterium sp. A321]
MKAVKVQNDNQKREFLEFAARLYADDPHYIRPLDRDIEAVFNPKKNKLFQSGTCERFLFVDKENKTLGKVAVFVNAKYSQDQPTGGIGFFDCINDQNTANFIFDFAKKYLQDRGMEAMDGSINFGERDKFWGVLIEGFEEPLYGMNYNAPYYQSLFENYGFQVYFNQLCFSRPVHGEVSRLFTLMHKKHSRNPELKAVPLKRNQLEKFAKDFTLVYNAAWASHGEGKQMDPKKALRMFKSMKPLINEHISWFVYHNDEPIAMWLNLPDVNQWFKYLKGRFGLLQKLQFLWLKRFKKNTTMVGIVFGIVPEWQKTGLDGYMIWEGTQHLRKHTDFEKTELQWIGDFNPKMIKIAEALDTTVTKKLATYRYLFDREKPFKRLTDV